MAEPTSLSADDIAVLRAFAQAGPASPEGQVAAAMLRAAGVPLENPILSEPAPSGFKGFLDSVLTLAPAAAAAAGAASPLLVASGLVTGGVGTAIGAGAAAFGAGAAIASANKSSILDAATFIGV